MAELSNIIRSPSVASARATDNNSESCSRNGKVVDVQNLGTLNPMWSVKVAECTFTPDIELPVIRQRSRERSCSDLHHPTKGKLLEEGR